MRREKLANGSPIGDHPPMDFAAAGLLDGLDGAERQARGQLLERLAAQGVSLEEMRQAAAEHRLVLLAVERGLGGSHTAREIERAAELPAGVISRFQRLLGLPDPGDALLFGDEDLAAARSLKRFLESGMSPEDIAQITRVLGEAMGRVAATSTAAFADTFLKAGDTELDAAERFLTRSAELVPDVGPVLLAAYRAKLRDMLRRGALSPAERQAGSVSQQQEMGVCFADLVGFTRLGSELETEELGGVATRLGELAAEVAQPPVRLVKTIGDAAMFVSVQPAALVLAALELLERAEAEELPSIRAGVASGPAAFRAGDFYGHAVNVASRVTGVARPGSVLCTKEVRDAAGEAFEWSFARRHRLKGVGDAVPLYRARPLPSEPAKPAALTRSTAGRPRR